MDTHSFIELVIHKVSTFVFELNGAIIKKRPNAFAIFAVYIMRINVIIAKLGFLFWFCWPFRLTLFDFYDLINIFGLKLIYVDIFLFRLSRSKLIFFSSFLSYKKGDTLIKT